MQRDISVSIGADIYEYLKGRSTFEDTVSSVLRRELDLPTPDKDESASSAPSRGASDHREQSVPAPRASNRAAEQRSAKRPSSRRRRAAAGTLLPESEYLQPILEVLASAGGHAAKQLVIEEVGKRLDGQLTEADREELESGGIRWQSRIQFARLRLADRGLVDKNVPRGTWAITPAGRKALEEGTV